MYDEGTDAFFFFLQVGIVDLDICGPSVPKLMGVENQTVVNSQYGWVPVRYCQMVLHYIISACSGVDSGVGGGGNSRACMRFW